MRKSVARRIGAGLLSFSLLIGYMPYSGQGRTNAAETEDAVTIHAAAYVNAEDLTQTNLPDTVEIGGTPKEVSWNFSQEQCGTLYSVAEITGTTADEDTVTAYVEVIPQDLVFFADIGGVGGMDETYTYDSPVYEAISELIKDSGNELINDAADAVYNTAAGWGHNAYNADGTTENRQYADETTAAYDKTESRGLYTEDAAGAKVTYAVPLKAGTYTVSMGLHDWEDAAGRCADIYVTTPDAGRKQLGSVSYICQSQASYVFNVQEEGEVLFELTGGIDKSPALSWLAIASGEVAVEDEGVIVVDGNDIRTDNVNGLTYKGFGLLSGNSTSDLLMDYKAENPEAYAQLMQYLFGGEYPIMNHVKLEMGNDRNNSTGAEAATKRSKDEEANILRNPGWQLAADAKKINPDLKVSILRWNQPTWVQTDEDIYTWYKETILKAYETYGYMVDYINPNVNERWGKDADVAFTKLFARWIAAETEETIPDETARTLFQQIKLVVSDESGTVSTSVANNLKEDEEFFNSVDVVGYHYSPDDDNNGGMKWLAEEQDKEVWNSEAQATFSNTAFRPFNTVKSPSVEGTGIGGTGSALEMGNTFIKGFVRSRRSHVIYQPAIGSFYEGGQYSSKELVSARDPWSGWIHYDAGLLVLAHLSKFAKTGWENEENTAGIWRAIPEASKSSAIGRNPVNGRNGGENCITLASPEKNNFSTVIVNDSEYPITYNIKVKNMDLEENQRLGIWETRAADDGAFNENYMQYLGDVLKNDNGQYIVTVKPNSVVTVTTLDVSGSEEHTTPLPVEGERTVLDTDSTGDVQNTADVHLYADDFDYTGKTVPVLDGKGGFTGETEDYIASRGGDTGAIARYTHTVNGAFEAYRTSSGNYVLRQQLDQDACGVGGAWNDGDAVTLIGDFRWLNYTASVDVLFEHTSHTPYAAVAIRQTGSSQNLTDSSGYTLKVFETGDWELYRKGTVVQSGTVTAADGFQTGAGVWNNLKLKGAGATITAYINDKQVASYTDSNPVTAGRIGLGSAYTFTQFDNLEVTKIDGEVPYYTELLDNMEAYDLTPEKNPKLVYDGKWSHENGKGMYVYQRSTSVSQEAGASLTYTFTGTGLEILAGTTSTAKLLVTVDGTTASETTSTKQAGDMNTIYSLKGLSYGEHTVTLAVAEGTLTVDMVGILGDIYKTPADEPQSTATGQPPAATEPAQPSGTNPPESPSETSLKKGDTVKAGQAQYKITNVSKKQVTYQKPTKTAITNVTVPATVKITSGGKTVTYQVTAINDSAFTKCRKLKSVTIGKNITSIGKNAFKGCKNLKKINIKSTVLKQVGKNAIQGIHKKAVIRCSKKKLNAYKKLFLSKTGFKKTMKIRK